MERFGGSVAVLRAAVTRTAGQGIERGTERGDEAAGRVGGKAGARAGGRDGLLVLSCEGRERRLSLTLPEPLPDASADPAARPVLLLLRPVPPGPGGFLLARARLTGGRGLALAAGEGAGVPGLVRMLRAAPARLDLLVAPARPGVPALFAAPAPVVLLPVVRRDDLAALDDFLRACGEG